MAASAAALVNPAARDRLAARSHKVETPWGLARTFAVKLKQDAKRAEQAR
jgi:hypothetical protein